MSRIRIWIIAAPLGLALTLGATLCAAPQVPPPSDQVTRLVSLVRQDFSDCTNSTVRVADSALAYGEVLVTRKIDGNTMVTVKFTKVAPNTIYHFNLKCIRQLGDILTDAAGGAEGTFTFPTNSIGTVFAFDTYPEGAPSGYKYQSVQVNFE
jgi:hypothetical protein